MPPAIADVRNSNLTFAAGDCVAYRAPVGTPSPAGFELLDGSLWGCLGWIDTTGYTFKLTETTKDITAAGTLSAIRTIITGGNKEIVFQCLESMNPRVRSLYDDVLTSQLLPAAARVDAASGTTSASPTVTDTHSTLADVGKPVSGAGIPAGATVISVVAGTSLTLSAPATATGASVAVTVGGGTVASYILPEIPQANRYAFIFDTFDGDKRVRAFAPAGMVTARGDDVSTQADVENMNLTLTLYPADIGGVRGTLKRYIDYGSQAAAIASYT